MQIPFSRRRLVDSDGDRDDGVVGLSGAFNVKFRGGKQPSWKGWLAAIVMLTTGLGFLWNLLSRLIEFIQVGQ